MSRIGLLAWLGWGVASVLWISALGLLYLTRDAELPESFGFRGATAIIGAAASSTAIVILARRPRNVIAWLLLLSGLSGAAEGFANLYAIYALVVNAGTLPFGIEMAWLQSWGYIPMIGAVICMVALFPDGRLVSPRWRPIVYLVPVCVVSYSAGVALKPGALNNLLVVDNPVIIPAAWTPSVVAAFVFGYALGLTLLVAAALSLVVRFRRARGDERAQLRWIAFSAAWLGVAIVPSTNVKIFEYLALAGFCAFDIAIGVAVLKYRLYDIDVLINRTLVYGVTSGAIAAIFFVGIVALQFFLRPVTSGNELAVAASTLLSFGLFQRVRRRVQDAVDWRFDRSRYDAARTLDAFADRLRDEVDLDALRSDLLRAVHRTMAPAHSSLWLRGART